MIFNFKLNNKQISVGYRDYQGFLNVSRVFSDRRIFGLKWKIFFFNKFVYVLLASFLRETYNKVSIRSIRSTVILDEDNAGLRVRKIFNRSADYRNEVDGLKSCTTNQILHLDETNREVVSPFFHGSSIDTFNKAKYFIDGWVLERSKDYIDFHLRGKSKIHGDLAIWNVIIDCSEYRIIDFEDYRERDYLLFDVLRFWSSFYQLYDGLENSTMEVGRYINDNGIDEILYTKVWTEEYLRRDKSAVLLKFQWQCVS
jgi:hypothetical protein